MLMRIVQQINGLIMGLYTRLSSLVKEQLLPNVNRLRVSITQAFQSVLTLFSQLAKIVLNIKAFLANLTTQAQSIKAAFTAVKAKAIQAGQLLLIIVRPTSQPVPTVQSPKKGRPAGSTKSAQSLSKENKTAQTLTDLQSTVDGLKSVEVAKQLRQRATKQSKKGK